MRALRLQGCDRQVHLVELCPVLLFDLQVMFMKELIAVLQQPPPWLKFPMRFGTYFLPVDKRRAPSTKLPRLLDK